MKYYRYKDENTITCIFENNTESINYTYNEPIKGVLS